ncbi:MAG: hypothetical protein KBF54_05945 [Rhizobiales bacterium]|nr:hypothetical protein [Hyphomicrobiales bacterium]
MSETEPRSPAMVLQAAARLAPFPVKDGWPEHLTPSQLARLQYPDEGSLPERKRAIPMRNDFSNLVNAAIAAGQLSTVAVERKADAQQGVSTVRAANGLGSQEWRNEQFATSSAPPVEKAASSAVQAVTRKACGFWFSATREIPRSDYVRAWLGDESQDEASSVAPLLPIGGGSSAGELATTRDVRAIFAAVVPDANSKAFERALGEAPKWISDARKTRVGKGKSGGYWWDVAVLAEAITAHFQLKREAVLKAIKDKWPNAAESYSA